MPFILPTFNLTVNVWYAGVPVANPPSLVVMGNLAFSKRTHIAQAIQPGPAVIPICYVYLLLPALTDIRGRWENGGPNDIVEVPAGTGRYYGVVQVEDIGKGFANEHRVAVIFQTAAWPIPIP